MLARVAQLVEALAAEPHQAHQQGLVAARLDAQVHVGPGLAQADRRRVAAMANSARRASAPGRERIGRADVARKCVTTHR